MNRAEAIKTLTGLLDAFDQDEYGDYFYDNGWDVCEATILSLAALREQEQSKWISVKERLPERMKRYFIAYMFEGSGMRFYGEAMFHPKGGNGCVGRPHFSNEGVDGMYVTHWMEIPKLPLPEPPEGGAE